MKRFWHDHEVESTFSWWRWLRLNLILLVLTGLISLSFPVVSLNHRLGDSYFKLRGTRLTSNDVGLVLIDDTALSQYGRWPWPRERLAQVVRAVNRFHPRVIGIDILLSEPENEGNDLALETAIRAAGNVVLPSKISSSQEASSWIDPLPRFAKAAAGIGHAQAALDSDGACRRIPAFEPSADGLRPAFAVAIANLAQNGKSESQTPAERPATGFERFEPVYLTIDYRQQFAATEAVPPFVTMSVRDLLQGQGGKALEGKIVLIGFGASELSDRLFTPVSGQAPMPGVEVNANAVTTLLENRQIKNVGTLIQVFLLLIIGMMSLWLVMRWPGAQGLVALAAVLFCEYIAGYFAFALFHRQVEYGPFLMAGVLAAPLAQLESLFAVDRAITQRLKQLQVLLPAPPPQPGQNRPSLGAPAPDEHNPSKVIFPRRASSSRLHWKLGALQRLEGELTSLYTFDETLLEGMRETLAVYDRDGRVLFHNSSWKIFCEQHDLNGVSNLEDLARILGLGLATDLSGLVREAGAWWEKELFMKETAWRFRAVRLPWPSAAEPNAIMLLGEDISARRERDQARAEAIGFVTHELRTPLIAIQGFAELLMRYPQQAASSEAPTTIFRESRRLVAMINAYLEVLRMDVGSRPLRTKPVEIAAMIHHVEQILQPLAQSAHIEIYTEIAPKARILQCDELLVTGALLNLLSNAVKYSPSGTMVRLQVLVTGEQVEFQVRNSGPVIPHETLEHLFEPYYRVADRTDEEPANEKPGWGLGLAFVKRISEQHGGRVQVSSSASAGTCFCLTLPLYANIASEAVV